MKAVRFAVFLVLAGLGAASAAHGQSLAVLRDIEDRLLQRRIDAYRDAHRVELDAIARLQSEVQRLYVALGDRNVGVEELRTLEADVALLRETALLRARQSTEMRMELYGRMERLEELDNELLRDGSPLQGTWTIDLGPEGQGTVKFFTYSGRVEATYELTSGARGTLRGVLQGNYLELERIDSVRGADRKFLGQISDDGQRIAGTWEARELAAGEPAAGTWTAQRAVRTSAREPARDGGSHVRLSRPAGTCERSSRRASPPSCAARDRPRACARA